MKIPELNFNVATLSNFQRVVASLRRIVKKFAHFPRRFQIIIVRRKFQAVFVAKRLARLNAQQQIMKLAVLAAHVMRIVRCNQRNIHFGRKFFQLVANLRLLLQAVILYFQKKILSPENVNVFLNQFLSLRKFVVENGAGDFADDASTKRDKSFVIFAQLFLVDTRAIIKTLNARRRRQLYQIFIARVVFGKQNQMKIFCAVSLFAVEERAGRDVNFTADNRLNAASLRRLVKINHAVHCAVIRYREGIHAEIFRGVEQVVNPRRAVKQAVFGVNMQMNKIAHENPSRKFLSLYQNSVAPTIISDIMRANGKEGNYVQENFNLRGGVADDFGGGLRQRGKS